MPVLVRCPCGRRLRVRDELLGTPVRCPACKAVLPGLDHRPPAAATPSGRWLETHQAGETTVARLLWPDFLDEQAVGTTADLLAWLVRVGCRRLVLDFGQVERLGSLMVSKLVGLRQQLQEGDGRLAVCNVRAQVRDIFAILSLDRLFDVYDGEVEALEGLQPETAG